MPLGVREHADLLVERFTLWHGKGGVRTDDPAQGPVFDFSCQRWAREARTAPLVLIIAPSPVSLYTLAVLCICVRLRVPVAVTLRRVFTGPAALQALPPRRPLLPR